MYINIGCIGLVFLCCFFNVPCKIICRVSCVLTLVAFMGLFSTTVFHQPINPSTHFVQFIKSQEETFKDYRIMDPEIPGQIILGLMILGSRIVRILGLKILGLMILGLMILGLMILGLRILGLRILGLRILCMD